ncbi:FkbM family methyltransferase [Profundibacter amoris]|uniref:FkbM family methyltransferase n=1 Tax=Profundibacter amoris TaxID=2171755 RepID=A0A347UE29_9RHOB|nr:FkbM family methyltransferase [Profundibacter amoris]
MLVGLQRNNIAINEVKLPKYLIDSFILRIPDHLMNDNIRRSMQGGRYEGHETHAVKKHIEEQDRVLELGAGTGYVAMQIACRIDAGNLLAIEANPKMIPVIEKNLTANALEDVTVVNAAVVPDDFSEDQITFHITAAFWASSLNPTIAKKWKSTKSVKVPAIKIGTLFQEHKPTVVIMDIEGGEEGLFDSLWPEHIRLLVIELHPTLYPDRVIKQIFDQMSASGLTYCPIGSRGQVVVFKRVADEV